MLILRSGDESFRCGFSCRGHPGGRNDDEEHFPEDVLKLADAVLLGIKKKMIIKTCSEHPERINSTRSRNCRDKHVQTQDM